MYSLSEYFGKDNFNANNYTNLNLSKIIYILYKMLKNIDKNTNFYDELKQIFIKYNIILNINYTEIENVESCLELLEKVKQLDEFELDNTKIIEDIENKKAYKKNLKSQEKQFEGIKKEIIRQANKVKVVIKKSKYVPFTESKRYTQFTGIDYKFFNNIL